MLNANWIANAAYRWAYPRGEHHQLLVAAIGSDDAAGLNAVGRWLNDHDIDDVKFREQRLLLAIIGRYGATLAHHHAYPRLVGLQKLLWSRSLMALQEAKPALRAMVDAGRPVMVIKGAARLAVEPTARATRVAWDLDICVTPETMLPAFDALVGAKWQPSSGASKQYLRRKIRQTRSINLYKGNFGDIDLHSLPFHPGQGKAEEDRALWQRSRAATLVGVDVCVPSSEDRIALAIAHGCLDGHCHSDWLVDCAAILKNEQLDLELLAQIVTQRGLQVPAYVTFSYFANELGLSVPPAFLNHLSHAAATTSGVKACVDLIQVRPKDRFHFAGQTLRLVAKSIRKVTAARRFASKTRDKVLHVRRLKSTGSAPTQSDLVKAFDLPVAGPISPGNQIELQLVLDTAPFRGRRRVELEINSPDSHVCRIRYRRLRNTQGAERLKVTGQLSAADLHSPLKLTSQPSRQLRPHSTTEEREQCDSVAFRVVSCTLTSKSMLAPRNCDTLSSGNG